MKKIIITFSFLFFTITLLSQFYLPIDYFDTHLYPEISNSDNYSAGTDLNSIDLTPKVFNVHFYGLERTTEPYTGSDALTEELALERIAQLNIAFNPYNVFFKYRGYSHYSEIYDGDELSNINNHSIIMNRMDEVIESDGNSDKINIILHHPGSCTNDKGSTDIYNKILSLRYCTSEDYRLIYQMGHLFGLFKTQRGVSCNFDDNIPQDPYCNDTFPNELVVPNHLSNPVGDPENVTRDPDNPYYNANIAGDMVVDTPACFMGSEFNYCHSSDTSFEYLAHSDIVDDSPEHLMYVDVDIKNFMSAFYGYGGGKKRTHFTPGQGVRMRETIEIPSLNFLEVETIIESLYEPYKDNATVATSDFVKHYYQPGFNYKFVNCNAHNQHGGYPEPSDYDDTSFDYNVTGYNV